jgi:LPXTG-motif cell wall-anchored protein
VTPVRLPILDAGNSVFLLIGATLVGAAVIVGFQWRRHRNADIKGCMSPQWLAEFRASHL